MGKKFIEVFKESIGQTFGRLTVLDSEPYTSENKKAYFVKCRCSCGVEKFTNFHAMKRGEIVSCGCLQREWALIAGKKLAKWTEEHGSAHKKDLGVASFNGLYGQYRYSAKVKKLEFLLTREEFGEITKRCCHYCGSEPQSTIKLKGVNGDYIYNGIDRKDNNLGYTISNSLTCCSFCNYSKRSNSYNEFIDHVKKIYEHLNEKKS